MKDFDPKELKKLYVPHPDSHKGQNGKLLLISGSKLFHSSSLWALNISSRILDMVYYSSIKENNKLVSEAKKEFRNGIIVPRNKIKGYIDEADCILIGPGLPRKEGIEKGDDDTGLLTETLLKKHPEKKWIIDGGSLQTINPEILKPVKSPILTPHFWEFEILKSKIQNLKFKNTIQKLELEEQVKIFSKEYGCTVVLKGPADVVCSPEKCVKIKGGNAGMTKGGTGDVLAALVASLYCKNDAFLSACAGSYFNKKAGESLFKKAGLYYNASDLVDELPHILKKFIL